MMRCEAQIVGVCAGAAVHGHHRQLRRGKDNSRMNLLDVCALCHHHIHHHVDWALSWGLLVLQDVNPADVAHFPEADPDEIGPYPTRLRPDGRLGP